MMTDQEPKMTDPKLKNQPPHGWLWESLAALWNRKTTVIAALCVMAILVHLLLRFAFQVRPAAYQLPLLATLVLGGIPLYGGNQRGFSSRLPAGQLVDQVVAGLRTAGGLTGGKRRV
jgi:hypothetical protein